MPFGYSNGANFPTGSLDATLAHVREIALKEREFASGTPILVMNGTDHASPDPDLPIRLDEARARGELEFEIGTLAEYVRRLSESPLDGVPRWRGELRSPARAHLLPGVTSVRAWIKQRDFLNCYLLERLADPLAALSRLAGNGEDLGPYLELAWRMEIQNHPHDSICGCSIDQVHQDMRYRFDQAAMIAELVIRRASGAIFRERSGLPAIAVFNPTFARRALVTGEVDIEDPDARYEVEDASGKRIPTAIEVARGECAFETEMAASELKRLVAGLSSAELMGRFVNRYEIRRCDGGSFEVDLFLSRNALTDLDVAGFKNRISAELPDEARVKVRAMTAARANLAFVADGLQQAGFCTYRLVRAGAGREPDIAAPGASIENDRYRIGPSSRGLAIDDLESGKRFELYFEDEGDRGDEYNFDPVPGAPAIAEPESLEAAVLERGTARSRLSVSLVFRIPASLASGRMARANETVRMHCELMATLYPRLDRVDFEATVDNRARDHRLRVALATPVAADESLSDTSFGMVRRAVEPQEPAGTEDIYPTTPHRTMTAIESAELSAALISRGLYEAEVRRDAGGATILLTLLRCVGWLSRSDLKTRRGGAGPEMETPGAQEIALYRFEFALTSWRGSYWASDALQRAQAYAFPPRIFNARDGAGVQPSAFLCDCDNPRILFSTARAGHRSYDCIVRVFSASEESETARFRFATESTARIVDLSGRQARGANLKRLRDGTVETKLRPFQIATFEVRRAWEKKIFHASDRKD